MIYNGKDVTVTINGRPLIPVDENDLEIGTMNGNNPDKGLKNGSCNVTACQKPGAIYFNKSTRAYYCEDCAREINWPGGRADCMELYGTPLLCEKDEP